MRKIALLAFAFLGVIWGSNFIFVAQIRTAVCHSCGHVRIFASEEARKKLKTSKHWKAVGA